MGNVPVDVTDDDVAQAAEAQAGQTPDRKPKKAAAKKAAG